MRFVEVKDEGVIRRWGKHQALITEFLNSNMDIAEVLEHECRDSNVAAAGLKVCAKRCRFPVDVFSRDGRVFIVRKHKDE